MTPKSVISYSVPGPSGTPMFPSHRRPLPAGAGKVREMRTRSRGPVVGVVNLPALTAGLANKLTNSHRSVHTYTHAECASMCTEENGRKRSAAGCRCWYNPNNSRVALGFCFLRSFKGGLGSLVCRSKPGEQFRVRVTFTFSVVSGV